MQVINGRRTKMKPAELDRVESSYDSPARRLVSYGTLRPGECNHHIVADVKGEWIPGIVRGSLAVEFGYLVLSWDEEGEDIEVLVLNSRALPSHYPRIDEFEGTNYSRALVPVHLQDGRIQVCNVYVKRTP